MSRRRIGKWIGVAMLALLTVLAWRTLADLQTLPASLDLRALEVEQPQYLDRHGTALTVTYRNRWNLHDVLPLHNIPPLLQQAFVLSEDQRFFTHHGTDWRARLHAALQNLMAMRVVRGASTISEQVVRILYPRPRTLWSRWLEGIEAARLEAHFRKADILEFYLNQVPYARQRRGVAQAARYYFDRELATLNTQEMLALVVLVRAPGRLDLTSGVSAIAPPLKQLAERLHDQGRLSENDLALMDVSRFALVRPPFEMDAAHFILALGQHTSTPRDKRRVYTTLDAVLQQKVQAMLDTRLEALRHRAVSDGAVLVVDHQSNEILAWVNGGGYDATQPGGMIDAITTPRQPGSTLKPFLYAMALEQGWTAATLIDDSPLATSIGTGLHNYHNYSRQHYGSLRLREALGNSLNIPAIRTIGFVGRAEFQQRLRALGFTGLTQHPDYYGDGLALGNGEVTLLELVQAYATLARQGVFSPLRRTLQEPQAADDYRRLYRDETSSLIAHILSDPSARQLEFGDGNLLRFPVQTAVKTGTANDYRDAWAVGFSHRHTVGVWMGNLDRRPMREVTGSIGPALVLRAVFAELNRAQTTRPLHLDRRLQAAAICRISGQRATPACPTLSEWFIAGSTPGHSCPLHGQGHNHAGLPALMADPAPSVRPGDPPIQLLQPTPGLQLAMDPRLPDKKERFPLRLPDHLLTDRVEWFVDGRLAASISGNTAYLWPLVRGQHTASARYWLAGQDQPHQTESVRFVVK